MATLLAALLRDGPPEGLGPVRCVALGPAAVLSAELAEAAAPFTISVILGCGGAQSMPKFLQCILLPAVPAIWCGAVPDVCERGEDILGFTIYSQGNIFACIHNVVPRLSYVSVGEGMT